MHRLKSLLIICILFVFILSPYVAAEQNKLVIINVGTLSGTQKAVAAFTAKTGIQVEVIIATWQSFQDKVSVMLATDQQLDLIRCDTGRAAWAAMNGILMPLTPLIKRDDLDLSVFPQPLLWHPPYKILGELYTLPYNYSVSCLWYNRNHFDEAGVAYPSTKYGHPSTQLDNWILTSRKLTRRDAQGAIERWGTNFGGYGWLTIGMFGVDWVNSGIDQFLGTDPKVVKAYERLTSLFMEEEIAPKPTERGKANFLAGNNLASQYEQTWWLPQINSKVVDVGIAPVPWANTLAVQAGIGSWGISAKTKNKEAAWEFVKYFTYGDGILAWMDNESLSPVLNRRYGPQWVKRVNKWIPNADPTVILEAGNYYWNTLIALSPGWPTIQPILSTALQSVEKGEKPMLVAMESISDQINTILKENPFFKK